MIIYGIRFYTLKIICRIYKIKNINELRITDAHELYNIENWVMSLKECMGT